MRLIHSRSDRESAHVCSLIRPRDPVLTLFWFNFFWVLCICFFPVSLSLTPMFYVFFRVCDLIFATFTIDWSGILCSSIFVVMHWHQTVKSKLRCQLIIKCARSRTCAPSTTTTNTTLEKSDYRECVCVYMLQFLAITIQFILIDWNGSDLNNVFVCYSITRSNAMRCLLHLYRIDSHHR